MDPILRQFITLIAALKPAAGATAEDLAELRRFIAAIIFQQNPGFPIPVDPGLDPKLAAALAAGFDLAAELTTAGTRARFLQESELSPIDSPEQPAHVFGPFLDASGRPVRFVIFLNAKFQIVRVRSPLGNPLPEAILVLPIGATSADGNRTFDIPAGSVWIRSRFLVPNGPGHTGLRIARAKLSLNKPATAVSERGMLLPDNTQWTLSVEPEQPPAASPTGPDANGATITLPQVLEVGSATPVVVSGAIALEGFGSDLRFETPNAAPVVNGASIDFAFAVDSSGINWTIEAHRSTAAQLTGSAPVLSAAWSLPINAATPNGFAEAFHGGSLVVVLRTAITVHFPGVTGGAFRTTDSTLTANARYLDFDARRPECSGRLELELWRSALTRLVFTRPAGGQVRFASERDRGDFAVLHENGAIRNRWDLPLSADGSPFGFEGFVENFGILERTAQLYILCEANQEGGGFAQGVALENIYLTVLPPNRLTLFGSYDGTASAPDGLARLFFNVILAQPTLPDPYAASWNLLEVVQGEDGLLSLALTWLAAAPPALDSRLERRTPFPEPRAVREEDTRARGNFSHHLGAPLESLSLLDLSSKEHHFGVALEPLSDQEPLLRDNRLTVRLHKVRLLMQPQVLWEPVQARTFKLLSTLNAGRTLLGANTVTLVPVLPIFVTAEWLLAAHRGEACGAMFALPFGLTAFARIDAHEPIPLFIPPIEAGPHQVAFGPAMNSALQVRLAATGKLQPDKRTDPARAMTGSLEQADNLLFTIPPGLRSVIDDANDPIIKNQINSLGDLLPLHQVDLSGYGLSTFSDWSRDVPVGVTQVRFDVLNGRTSLEIIQSKTILAPCEAYLKKTVIMERRNSGSVLRHTSGWLPVTDGLFEEPAKFDKGVVIAYRNIRRVRVLARPEITLSDTSIWREVLYDCDAHLENVTANGVDGLVPLYDQTGFILEFPGVPGGAPTKEQMALLFATVKLPMGGPADCGIRIGATLEAQVSGIFAATAPKPDNPPVLPGFVLAAYVSPKLPRAGQWSSVRIHAFTGEAAPVDPRHGIPVIRRAGQPYQFLDPTEAYRDQPLTEYGLMMATSSSRILFPKPTVNPAEPNVLRTSPPAMADPLALAQSTGAFPRAAHALQGTQLPKFDISAANDWKLDNAKFDLTRPAALDLAKGAEWAIKRAFPPAPTLSSVIDSAIAAQPWDLGVTPNDINIDIPGLGTIFTIKTNYAAVSGALPKLQKPTLVFGEALKAVKELVNSLDQFIGLGLDIDVDVDEGTGPSPSFIVRITLRFRLGEGPNERIDIGVGKFYGEFQIHGELEAALSGSTRGKLLAEFQGDIQQGILPPLVYGGGLFRFALEIRETGKPLIELGLGVTVSIGGDIIKNLIEVEVTIKYAYMLIPETLQPGVLLGLEARAKLLSGLIGFSFAVQVMARIQRVSLGDLNVTIFADIRVVATVQIAWLIEEDIDIRTQFEQKLPLGLAALPLGGGALAVVGTI